jgi:protein TonB
VETVTPPMFNVSYLHNPPPAYPRLAKRRGEQGTVVLSVHVSAQGQAQTIQLKRSSGSPRLDSAAETAVRNWRFVPAKRGDTAIAEWVIVPIQFTLE